MISGMYLGEIVRQCLIGLISDFTLFRGRVSEQLQQKDSFTTIYVSEFCRCVCLFSDYFPMGIVIRYIISNNVSQRIVKRNIYFSLFNSLFFIDYLVSSYSLSTFHSFSTICTVVSPKEKSLCFYYLIVVLTFLI